MKLTPQIRQLILLLAFGISYSQQPLYYSNQNLYFLHGLADAGVGFLQDDPLARTTDPFPVFSYLVKISVENIHKAVFYVYYLLLLGIYIFATLGIIAESGLLKGSAARRLVCFLLITASHSPPLGRFSTSLLGVDLIEIVQSGLAGQYILGPEFQPSVFGIFLILSIYFALRGSLPLATLCAAVAATLHLSYLLSAAALTLSYMYMAFKQEGNARKAMFLGGFSLILVLPVTAYAYMTFVGPESQESLAQAQEILVQYRIRHHADPGYWFGESSVLQLMIVVTALYSMKGSKVFAVLFIPFLIAAALTFVQILSGHKGLALIFPWRISAFLVPISTSLIIARCVSVVPAGLISVYGNPARLVVFSAMASLALAGILTTIYNFDSAESAPDVPAMSFAAASGTPRALYLIPVNMEKFRIYTGVPVFVDHKAHPYKANEVIDWHERLRTARQFYSARGDHACKVLDKMVSEHSITHILWDARHAAECPGTETLYQDKEYFVYQAGG